MKRTRFPPAKVFNLVAEAKRRRPRQPLRRPKTKTKKSLGLAFFLDEVELDADEHSLCKRLLTPDGVDERDEYRLFKLIEQFVHTGKLIVTWQTVSDNGDGGEPIAVGAKSA